MIHKDRYSKAFLYFFAAGVYALYLFREEKEFWASALMATSMLPTLYLFNRPARVHLSGKAKQKPGVEYKGEGDCGFTKVYTKQIDGLRIKGRRFKYVNGTDVCMDESLHVKSCFVGSQIMQCIGGGGSEPESIQNDPCWK